MKDLITSVRLVIVTMIICCVAYPAALLAFARIVAPAQAAGSLVQDESGAVVGSSLVAQAFTQPRYFWPRPSAVDYNAAGAGGSNLSPANPLIADRARGMIERFTPAQGELVPADLVTASGSGLDPHITLAAARLQLPRVSAARGLSQADLERLLEENTEIGALRMFGGEKLVNVLAVNLALDRTARLRGQ